MYYITERDLVEPAFEITLEITRVMDTLGV